MKVHPCARLLLPIAALSLLAPLTKAQSTIDSPTSSSIAYDSSSSSAKPPPPVFVYTRPTEKAKVHNYLFDAFGPFPIAGAARTTSVAMINAPSLAALDIYAPYESRFINSETNSSWLFSNSW